MADYQGEMPCPKCSGMGMGTVITSTATNGFACPCGFYFEDSPEGPQSSDPQFEENPAPFIMEIIKHVMPDDTPKWF